MKTLRLASLTGAALFAAAAAWAAHQQVGYIIASWSCTGAGPGIWLWGVLAVALLLAGTVIATTGARKAGGLGTDKARPRRFLAGVGLMAAALFLFAIALQMAAALFLPGCVG